MELLQVAKLVLRRAKEKQEQGKVPTFLGINGLLALMYDNIVRYNNTHEGEGRDEYVLDLCVNGLFALQSVVPDLVALEAEETKGNSVEETDEHNTVEETQDNRYTAIKPGEGIHDKLPMPGMWRD